MKTIATGNLEQARYFYQKGLIDSYDGNEPIDNYIRAKVESRKFVEEYYRQQNEKKEIERLTKAVSKEIEKQVEKDLSNIKIKDINIKL